MIYKRVDQGKLWSICLIITDNNFFSLNSISIYFRYQSITIGGLNRLIPDVDFLFFNKFIGPIVTNK